MNNSGTHSCLTWDVFMSHSLIYGRNLHAIAREYHNGAPPDLKALFKDVDKKKNKKTPTESKNPQSTSSKSDHKNDKTKDKEGKKDKTKLKCFGRGRTGHIRKDCLCINHPDYNKSSDKWDDSANGKAWLAHSLQSKVLPMKVSLSGEPLPREHMDKIGKYLYQNLTFSICLDLHVIANKPAIDSNFKPATISHNDFVINTNILIDTGALQSNYVNEAKAIRARGQERKEVI
jgi:hypothetical protein